MKTSELQPGSMYRYLGPIGFIHTLCTQSIPMTANVINAAVKEFGTIHHGDVVLVLELQATELVRARILNAEGISSWVWHECDWEQVEE